MPVYNGERFMREAVESLLGQTHQDLELVITDNGSTDATRSIAQDYVSRDARVKYYRFRENYGVAHNLQAAYRLSSGRYFKWAAYDDVCAPSFVERCFQTLEEDASIVLAFPLTVGIDEAGARIGIPTLVGPGYEATDDYSDLDQESIRFMSASDPVVRFSALLEALWNAHFIYGLIRSEALSQISLSPAHYAGDHLMLAELSLYGRFCLIPEEMFFLRIHEQRTSRTQTLRALSAGNAPKGGESQRLWKIVHGYPQRLGAYRRAVARSPLPPIQKVRCYGEITRALGKWARAKAEDSLRSRR